MAFQVMGVTAGRKDSNCEILLKEALLACREQGAEVRMINLKDYELLDCNGCTACTMGMSMGKNTGCSLADKDDKQKIMDVMLEQDAVIFSAPTYDLMPSSLFLKFMHRNLAYESAFLTKIGAIAPRDRVGALIAVGGSTRSWQSMALECMQATTFTNSFKIVDMYMATQVPAPAQVLLYEEKVARVREMGLNVMKALNTPPRRAQVAGRSGLRLVPQLPLQRPVPGRAPVEGAAVPHRVRGVRRGRHPGADRGRALEICHRRERAGA